MSAMSTSPGVGSRGVRDVTWRPAVPNGHTPFSWGHLKQQPHPLTAGPPPSTAQRTAAAPPPSLPSAAAIDSVPSAVLLPPTPPSSTPRSRLPSPSAPPLTSPSASAAPVLPIAGHRNVLITSALPYVNNVPHLGNLIGAVLSADVFARFCRLRGYPTLFLCGTDEYGTATETKAIEMGLTPQQICDHFHTIHADIYRWFDCSFDLFGRTTTPQQTVIAQDIFNKADTNGYLLSDELEQLYCERDSRFLADRFVEGICPHCQYPDARGDQCDQCGKLLNAIDLLSPKCKLCKTSPTVRRSRHLFLDLGRLQAESLSAWVEQAQVKGRWTDNSVAVTKAWLDGGLKPRCITRDLKWGTPVPKEGYEDKVFYVWFDAPIGYISIAANYTAEWQRWWKNPDDVQLYQFMGKDNVPFHCVVFPASLMATGERWTLLHHIDATEYLNYEGMKFSKSRGTGVFGDDVMSTGIPSEVWRYYMLYNRPEQSDTFFLWEDLQAKTNQELGNNLGNFNQRVLAFIHNNFAGVIPAYGSDAVWSEEERQWMASIGARKARYVELMEEVKLKEALKEAMAISSDANAYTQRTQPWELLKTQPLQCRKVVNVSVNLCYLLALLLHPFMPSFTDKLCAQLNYLVCPSDLDADDPATPHFRLVIQPGHAIGTPSPLFKRIEDRDVVAMRAKFGGVAQLQRGADFPLHVVVGRVLAARAHAQRPNSHLVLTVDVGTGAQRRVVVGLKAAYSAEELQGRLVLLLLNVREVEVHGELSQALLLVGMKKRVSLLQVEQGREAEVKEGSEVLPVDCVSVGRELVVDWRVLEKKLPMETGEGGKVTFGGLQWRTREGVAIETQDRAQGAKIKAG